MTQIAMSTLEGPPFTEAGKFVAQSVNTGDRQEDTQQVRPQHKKYGWYKDSNMTIHPRTHLYQFLMDVEASKKGP